MSRKLIDLTGQRFNMLVVLERHEQRSTNGQLMWVCQCDCGNKAIYSTGQLRSGTIKACGCLKAPTKKEPEVLVVPPEFEDCVCAASVGKYDSGCDAVSTLFCAKKGKCSFYKPIEDDA